jgi:hypothetical protein
MHPQDLIPPWIDHLDGDAAVVARRKGQRSRTGELCKGLLVQSPAQGLADFFPGILIQEEGLADSEAATVVIAVEGHDL